MSNNLKLWNSVCETNPKDTKGFQGKGGFKGTAICAQSQRRNATEVFGSFGNGWGVKDEVYEVMMFDPLDPHSSRLIYKAVLYYGFDDYVGDFPIAGEIDLWAYSKQWKQWNANNDIHKKVRTDAMTKGLSELGFNSDIFEGKFDDNKYIAEMKEKHEDEKSAIKPKPVDNAVPSKNGKADSKPTEEAPKPPVKAKEETGNQNPPTGTKPVQSGADTTGSGVGELFQYVIGVINGAPKSGFVAKDAIPWMREVNTAKKTDDMKLMEELVKRLNEYLEADTEKKNEIMADLNQLPIF